MLGETTLIIDELEISCSAAIVYLLGDSGITATCRVTVETKRIQDTVVITKLKSSSFEGKDNKTHEDSFNSDYELITRREEVLPYMCYISMCHPKGYGF